MSLVRLAWLQQKAHAPFGQVADRTNTRHRLEMKGEARARHACSLRKFGEPPVFARLFVNQREHRCETPIAGQAQPARRYRTLLLQMGTKDMAEHQVDKLSRRGVGSRQKIDALPHYIAPGHCTGGADAGVR